MLASTKISLRIASTLCISFLFLVLLPIIRDKFHSIRSVHRVTQCKMAAKTQGVELATKTVNTEKGNS